MLRERGDGQTVSCVWCGQELDFTSLTIDRIIPGSEGGSYRWDNVQPSCLPDNQARGDMPAEIFINMVLTA
jgi:5-methylcytosine-specific restriction endonuclease McrA